MSGLEVHSPKDHWRIDKGFTPHNNRPYTEKEYWEWRFSQESNYEWLTNYEEIKGIIDRHARNEHQILIVGCGNSRLTERLYQEGYHNIISTDYSETVISRMRRRTRESAPGIVWEVADMRALLRKFDKNQFDLVIDKAAMDAILAAEGNTWVPVPELLAITDEICRNVSGVLKPGGIYLQFALAPPHFRIPYLVGPDPDLAPSTCEDVDTRSLSSDDDFESEHGTGLAAQATRCRNLAAESRKAGAYSTCYEWLCKSEELDVGFGYYAYLMFKSRHPE